MKMDNQRIGTFIRELRKEKGMTQKDLAEHLHITDRAVSKWERGICAEDGGLHEGYFWYNCETETVSGILELGGV